MHAISNATVRECSRMVSELVCDNGRLQLPVDIEGVARKLGVKVVEPANLTIDGYIGANADGTILIRYRRENSTHRNRFTIAHEIGHL
jgi:Zn-dependent peptidase ImmA (M78 family)